MLLDHTVYSILIGVAGVLIFTILAILWVKLFGNRNARIIAPVLIVIVCLSGLAYNRWFALNVYEINLEQGDLVIEKKVLIGKAEYKQDKLSGLLDARAYQCYVINRTPLGFLIKETLYGKRPEHYRYKPFQEVLILPNSIQLVKLEEIDYLPGDKLPQYISSKTKWEKIYQLVPYEPEPSFNY